jgi:hypothetical protein
MHHGLQPPVLLLALPHQHRRVAGSVAHAQFVEEPGTAGRTASFRLNHGLTLPHSWWPQPARREGPSTSSHARHRKTRQTESAQPGSPFAPPATMATSWAAGFITSGGSHPSPSRMAVKHHEGRWLTACVRKRGSPQRRRRPRFDTRPTPATAQLSTVRHGPPSDPRRSILRWRAAERPGCHVARSDVCAPEFASGISVVRVLVSARGSTDSVGSLVRSEQTLTIGTAPGYHAIDTGPNTASAVPCLWVAGIPWPVAG